MAGALLVAALVASLISAGSSANQTSQQVPAAPSVPASPKPGDLCYLPPLPPKSESARLAMARRMLDTGNPDLVGMARDYLRKGLDEQFQLDLQRQRLEYERAMLLAQRGCPPEQ